MIVVAGEALVDIVTGPDSQDHEAVGGAPLNVAVGLGRLEIPVLLITQLGDDAFGRQILDHAAASDVLVEAPPTVDGRTATARVSLDAAGGATYDFAIDWTLPSRRLPDCDALHVGGLGAMLEPGRDAVWDLVEQAYARAVPVSYDPNIRPIFVDDPDQTWRDVVALADRATLVKLSDQDVALLHPDADPGDIARTLLDGERTELVVLTRGSDGATAFVERGHVDVPVEPVTVVDTVGAGDSFAAALLAVLFETGALGDNGGGLPHEEDQLVELLQAAMTVAAITCSRRGAQPPTRAELDPAWPRRPH